MSEDPKSPTDRDDASKIAGWIAETVFPNNQQRQEVLKRLLIEFAAEIQRSAIEP